MAKKLTKAIRSDKLKRLHEEAIKQGWTSSIDGNGHVVMTGPDGRRFWISVTNNGGAMGRHWMNTKMKARRAGLDVRKL